MLKRLTIKRFKSIYGASLRFGSTNLFVGVNGTGKSNVLEALGLLASALTRGLDGSILDSRGVRFSLPRLFKSSFKNTDLSPTFRLEAEFEYGSYSCSIRSGNTRASLEFHSEELLDGRAKVFGRGPNGNTVNDQLISISPQSLRSVKANRGFWEVLSPFAIISDKFRAELDQFSSYAIYAPQTSIMRGIANDPKVIEPLGLTGAGLSAAFNDVLEDLKASRGPERAELNNILSLIWAPGWANQVSTGTFNGDVVPAQVSTSGLVLYIRDKFMKTNRNMLSTFDASEGTLYLIFVATLLLHKQAPTTFALDNVDGTLNGKLVRMLTDKLVEVCTDKTHKRAMRPYQTFVTSHHPASLDSFDIFSRDQSIFVARRVDPEQSNEMVPGSTYFDELRPPQGMSKSRWIEQSNGKNLSELLLDGLIPGGM